MKYTNSIYKALILIISIGLAQAAWAAALNKKQVEQFIDTLPTVKEIGHNYPNPAQQSTSTRPFSSGLEQMAPTDPSYIALSKMSKNHGYKTVNEWAENGDRVLRAYILLSIGLPIEQLEQMRKQAMTVLNNPGLPAELRASLAAQLNSPQLNQFEDLIDSKQDVPAVQPYRGKLDALLKEK